MFRTRVHTKKRNSEPSRNARYVRLKEARLLESEKRELEKQLQRNGDGYGGDPQRDVADRSDLGCRRRAGLNEAVSRERPPLIPTSRFEIQISAAPENVGWMCVHIHPIRVTVTVGS